MSAAARPPGLTAEQLMSLGAFLRGGLRRRACDHTLRNTKEWILAHGVARSAKRIMKSLAVRGGFCDCEVLTNVVGESE